MLWAAPRPPPHRRADLGQQAPAVTTATARPSPQQQRQPEAARPSSAAAAHQQQSSETRSAVSAPARVAWRLEQARRNPAIQAALEARLREEKLSQLVAAKGHNIIQVREGE